MVIFNEKFVKMASKQVIQIILFGPDLTFIIHVQLINLIFSGLFQLLKVIV